MTSVPLCFISSAHTFTQQKAQKTRVSRTLHRFLKVFLEPSENASQNTVISRVPTMIACTKACASISCLTQYVVVAHVARNLTNMIYLERVKEYERTNALTEVQHSCPVGFRWIVFTDRTYPSQASDTGTWLDSIPQDRGSLDWRAGR